MIGDGSNVTLNLTLTVDSEVIFTTQGKDPFEYTHGEGRILPGLENQLAGLKSGEEKEIIVGPDDGYGVIDPEAFIEFPKTQLPEGDIQPGVALELIGPDGRPVPAVVTEIKEEFVILDLNHPLAGKELQFNVAIISIT